MIYYSSIEPFDFKTFKTIRSLKENIYSSKITINETNEEQADLIEYILNFNSRARPRNNNNKKINVFNTGKNLYDGRELFLNVF